MAERRREIRQSHPAASVADMSVEQLESENRDLRRRLDELEDTVRAIRGGTVDAFVIETPEGSQVYTLMGADRPYRIFIESMAQGALTLDGSGTILFCNPRFAELLQIETQGLIGESFRRFVAPASQPAIDALLEEGRRTSGRREILLRRPIGDMLTTLVMAQPLPAAGEAVLCLVVTDLTEQRRLHHDVLESQRKQEVLKEADRRKDDFLAMLSHELRSPLNAILGWTKILRADQGREASLQRALDVIERNVNLQTKLIEDLLDISRITSGKMELQVRTVQTAAVVQKVIDSVRPAAEKKDVRLVAMIGSSIPNITGDPERFQQALTNLLDNAIKFTPARGRIEVSVEHSDAHVRVRVADNGRGISPQFLPQVFNRFSQADSTTTRSHGGLGIGLTIVRHIVELHGGQVLADSPGEGQGATFVMEFPVRMPAAGPDDGGRRTDDAAPRSPWYHDLKGLRVLLIDDETEARDIIAEILTRCGAEVTGVFSAKEALKALKDARPDVLISDISMPLEDGYSLIEAVRQLPSEEGGDIPALALTARASEGDRSRLLAAGFQMHLPKPIDPTQLPAILAGLCRRTGSP